MSVPSHNALAEAEIIYGFIVMLSSIGHARAAMIVLFGNL